MTNIRAIIRNHVTVTQDLQVEIDTIYPITAVVRKRDGYMWVELFDLSMADHGDAELIGESPCFGDTYSKKGCDPASVREHVAKLIEASRFYN